MSARGWLLLALAAFVVGIVVELVQLRKAAWRSGEFWGLAGLALLVLAFLVPAGGHLP